MPSYTVIIQLEAEQDLDEVYHYFESQQQGLGFEFLAEITETIEVLEDNPMLFQRVYREMRRAIVKRFGYNLIYKVIENKVFILAIMHGTRDPERWQGRK